MNERYDRDQQLHRNRNSHSMQTRGAQRATRLRASARWFLRLCGGSDRRYNSEIKTNQKERDRDKKIETKSEVIASVGGNRKCSVREEVGERGPGQYGTGIKEGREGERIEY